MSITNILNSQALYYKTEMNSLLSAAQDSGDFYHAQSMIFRDFYNNAFVSSLTLEDDQKLSRGYFNRVLNRSVLDISILFDEGKMVSDEIAAQFNISKDHRTRAKNKTEYLLSLISNLNIMNNEENEEYLSFYDSLSNYSLIDENMIIGNKATISTSEGLAHLATSNTTKNLLSNGVCNSWGNGVFGNYGCITPVSSNATVFTHKYLSDIDSHANIDAIFDSQNNTWVEYQRIGSSEVSDKKKAEETIKEIVNGETVERSIWQSENELSDLLSLTTQIDLKKMTDANWLEISQYLPDDTRNGITINKINISEDGTNWSPLYPDQPILNQIIYAVPQLFDIDTSVSINKAMSQGVFIFPLKTFRYLEIIFTTQDSYNKNQSLGYTRYSATAIIQNKEVAKIVPKKDIPQFIIDSPQGTYKYTLNGSLFGYPEDQIECSIEKRIIPVTGWRYSIGIRDVSLSLREYLPSSILVSKKFETENPIKKIALYASEIIPDEFATEGLNKKEGWIKYSISFDDNEWYPISPVHHNQIGITDIAPKFYSFNQNISIEEKNSLINTAYIDTDLPIYSVRLKIEFNRPAGYPNSTPILQAYTLKCYTEE